MMYSPRTIRKQYVNKKADGSTERIRTKTMIIMILLLKLPVLRTQYQFHTLIPIILLRRRLQPTRSVIPLPHFTDESETVSFCFTYYIIIIRLKFIKLKALELKLNPE